VGVADSCAHAGLGIVNAIGSGGYGAAASLGLKLCVKVETDYKGYEGRMDVRGNSLTVERRLLAAIAATLREKLSIELDGVYVKGFSEIPLAAGLKGSSALINAVIDAVAKAAGLELELYRLARLGVEAAKKAGLTVTGALDDHLAVSGCGAYATINPYYLIRWEPRLSGWAVIVVSGSRDVRMVDRSSYAPYRLLFRTAWRLAVAGYWWEAALLNGTAMMLVHGDPLIRVLDAVKDHVSTLVSAGVSGKGPSVYLVYEDRGEAVRAASAIRRVMVGSEVIVAPLLACRQLA
jgi:shikimate kinase